MVDVCSWWQTERFFTQESIRRATEFVLSAVYHSRLIHLAEHCDRTRVNTSSTLSRRCRRHILRMYPDMSQRSQQKHASDRQRICGVVWRKRESMNDER